MADRFITPRWHYLAHKFNLPKQCTEKKKKKRDLRLPELPVDMQCCVLGFLKYDGLARLSSVSHTLRSVATLDRLWEHLLLTHYNAVKPLVWGGATPARQFRAMALAKWTVTTLTPHIFLY
jgi:hypothetical protein